MIEGVSAPAWRALIAACEAAWPREACGWLAATHAHRDADADVVRPAAAGGRDAFAFADVDLLALIAAYRHGPAPRALYHSHPRGAATLSAADRAALAPGGVVLHPLPHLVIAVRAGRAEEVALHRWRDGAPVLAAAVTRADGDRWCPRALVGGDAA